MTDGPIKACKDWTGDEPVSCPWRAFADPFVSRVLHAFPAYDKGQLSTFQPDASHRLIEGVAHYARADALAQRTRWELEAKARERGTAARA